MSDLELLTAEQVGKMLKLSRSTVYDLAAKGLMPCVVIAEDRIRPIVRFNRAEIERWVESRASRQRFRRSAKASEAAS